MLCSHYLAVARSEWRTAPIFVSSNSPAVERVCRRMGAAVLTGELAPTDGARHTANNHSTHVGELAFAAFFMLCALSPMKAEAPHRRPRACFAAPGLFA